MNDVVVIIGYSLKSGWTGFVCCVANAMHNVNSDRVPIE